MLRYQMMTFFLGISLRWPMLHGFWELVRIPLEPRWGKSHLEKRCSKINFQHIYAKARAKLVGLSTAEKSGSVFVYEVPGSSPLLADSSYFWMNETALYLQGILVLSVIHTDSLGHTRTGGKWVMLLNALNQALNLGLLSASLSIFTSLGSNGKALLSTMTT